MARRVLMAEVSGGRVRGRPRLGSMDGVKVALGNRGRGCTTRRERSERVESPCTYVTQWVSRCHFCLALCSFGPPSRALVIITWRGEGCRYMMRFGWTVKRAQLLKIKARLSSIWAKGCILMTVCYLTWHYYPSLVEGESHGILLLVNQTLLSILPLYEVSLRMTINCLRWSSVLAVLSCLKGQRWAPEAIRSVCKGDVGSQA